MTAVAPFFLEMEQYIALSRATVAANKELDLGGLDEKIDALCNMIIALSQEEKMLYEERLQELLGGLNALGNEMRAQAGDITEIPKHHQASKAYQTADSRDNFGQRNNTGEEEK